MSPTSIGLFAGLLVALITVIGGGSGGWGAFFLALVLGAVGLVVGRVVSGQLDLTQYIGGSGRGQR